MLTVKSMETLVRKKNCSKHIKAGNGNKGKHGKVNIQSTH